MKSQNPVIISVGICAHNEGQNLGRLLDTLLEEPVSEIIVAASGCLDDTEEITRGVVARDSRVRLISETVRKGKTYAFNQILREYAGSFLVSIPADVVPSRGFVMKLIERMTPDVAVVGGLPIPNNPAGRVIDDISRLLWELHNRTLESLSASNELRHVSGELFALRRGVIDRIPANTVNEDAFIAIAAKAAGYRVVVCPEALVTIAGTRTIGDYVRQRRRVLYGHLQAKKEFGRFPSVIEFEFPARPKFVWGLIRSLFRGRSRPFLPLFVGSLLEVIAFSLAVGDHLTGRTQYIWKQAISTKRLE